MVRTRASFLSDNDSQDVPRNDKDDREYRADGPRNFHRSSLYRSVRSRRRRTGHHESTSDSSSSSSDDDDSSDESHFEKKKKKNLNQARNRYLPLNFQPKDMLKGPLRDRQRIGSSLADIDPMGIDSSVTFDKIGGLDEHVQALKEMILFPLIYPEVFEKYKIHPPRGVLFHGPPGTGKTLVARALCNECSTGDRKVAFFMRKGADCLSKWVGESERQLRLLFDQAYSMRPAIIFFDEIDGIAPVRSTRQDQIHSSIVSTLLALMDGLDNRGEVIVIGATNRIDSIDPALRRPGRFDREFYFPLPSLESRRSIIEIHTSDWIPPLTPETIEILASRTVGYCGADIKALCAETALSALKRRYPQIYRSRQKLLLNIDEIKIELRDFIRSLKEIVPSTQRSVSSFSRPLCFTVKPLLYNYLNFCIETLNSIFPAGISRKNRSAELVQSDGDLDEAEVFENSTTKDVSFRFIQWRGNYRPRYLIYGTKGQGHSTHLGPAILHYYEHLYQSKLDYATIFSSSGRTPEESISALFNEASRRIPSIIYMPHINQWWSCLSDSLRIYLFSLIEDLEPHLPILLLATSDMPYSDLPDDIKDIFNLSQFVRLFKMSNPTKEERTAYFLPLFEQLIYREPRMSNVASLEVLPIAPKPEPRKFSEGELKKLRKKEEATLRELRLFLRDTLHKLSRDRRFSFFVKPVDLEEVPDYLSIIETPMSLETMMAKIDTHKYECASQFLADIDLICHNALEYNPDRDTADKLIRHRACALKDAANALIEAEMDSDFEQLCKDIHENRKQRGEIPTEVPSNYWTAFSAKNIKLCADNSNPISVSGHTFNEDLDTEIESLVDSPQLASSSDSLNVSKESIYKKRKVKSRKKRFKRIRIENHKLPNGINGKVSSKEMAKAVAKEVAKEYKQMKSLEMKDIEKDTAEKSVNVVKKLIIDRVQVNRVMSKVIDMSNNYNIEQLEELYSCLYRTIIKRSQDWDRSSLVKEMLNELEAFESVRSENRNLFIIRK